VSPFFRRPTAVERRLRDVRKELSAVRGNLRTLSRDVEEKRPLATPYGGTAGQPSGGGRPLAAPPAVRPAARSDLFRAAEAAGSKAAVQPSPGGRAPAARRRPGSHDDRFISYFSAGYEAPAPRRRHERTIRRNQKIAIGIAVAIVLIWALYLFVL
jgi:hypothetical protein